MTQAKPIRADLSAESPGAADIPVAQVAVFALGATSAAQIANVTATVLSVVCLLCVPGALLMRHRGVDLLPLALAALGWISFLVSGVIHGVSPLWPNALAPAAFSVYLIGLTVLTGRSVDLIATALAGIAAGTVGFFLIKGIQLTHTGSFLDLWKYGIAHAVTVVALFALTKAGVPAVVQAGLLAVLGVVSLGLNFRSHALVCLIAAAILLVQRFLGSRLRRGWQFACVIAFGFLFAYVMPLAARAGWFGPVLQHKTIQQEAIDVPILLAGRTELPMNLTAIAERPLLGWGSAMKLTPELYTQAEHLAVRMGFAPTFPFELYWRLPPSDYSATHSIILGSWVEGGVLAVLLPVFLLVACVGIVLRNQRFGVLAPLVLVVALQGIWDLAYAPWTYNTIAEYACITLLFGSLLGRAEPTEP